MFADRHPVQFHIMVVLSFAPAFLLAIIPLPPEYQLLRPELICLIVLYWVISTPQHLGITFAFFIGFAQDLIEHSVWGAHALGLAVVAYICINAYQRIISYSIWHQTLWMSVLIGVYQVIVNWVMSLDGYHVPVSTLLASIVLSTLMWPVVQLGVRRLRQYLRLL